VFSLNGWEYIAHLRIERVYFGMSVTWMGVIVRVLGGSTKYVELDVENGGKEEEVANRLLMR
jgi:hypothetical protein